MRRGSKSEKIIYLTFDDGPTNGITEEILNLLSEFSASATFFCTGIQANQNLDLLKMIEKEGHTVGYHSYSHKDILKTKPSDWMEDVLKKSEVSENKLFRPPYGRILPSHYYKLKAKYRFVFWDVISYDYNQDLSPHEVFEIVTRNIRNGSVVVFHDNKKAKINVLSVLKLVLQKYTSEGYKFEKIEF